MEGQVRNTRQRLTSASNGGPARFLAIFGVAAVALAIWFLAHQGLPWKLWSGDACEYAEMGRRLATGEGFTTGVIYPAELRFGAGEDKPAVMRPPAWPVALAAVFTITGPTETAAHALTGALFAGTAALTAALGTALGGPLVGVFAGIALTTTPAFLGLAMDPVSETPFAFLVTLAFLLFVRGRPAFAIGLVCGAAYLTRYNGLLLLPVFAVGLWWPAPRSLRPALLCCAGFAFVAVPWWIRNLLVSGDPFYSLLQLNLYFSPHLTDLHDSLYYVLEPDFDSKIAMHPVTKFSTQLPSLLAGWPLASLNIAACAGLLLASVRGHAAALALVALALGTTFAVALGLPQGRYFVPLLPATLALGACGWQRYGSRLATPGLALILLLPWLPSFPAPRDDLAMLTGYFDVERHALREDPERAARERARYEELRRCLPDHSLVLAQGAARLVWETGAIAIYAPNHPTDFWKIVDRYSIDYVQMERWRKIDRKRFELAFEPFDDCAADLYRRR
jgi:4-amino-4-deoxy-L-arabinose transferase-like glycosyltransferase